MAKRNPWHETLHSAAFRLIVLSGAALLLLAFVILRYEGFFSAIRYILHAFRPVLLGLLFATMLTPSYLRLNRDFAAFSARRHPGRNAPWIKFAALTGAALPPLLICASVICVLIPQLSQSLRLFTDNLGSYAQTIRRWLEKYPQTAWSAWLPAEKFNALLEQAQNNLPALLMKTYDHTASVLRCLADIGIGTVFSLYLLADRDRLLRQIQTVSVKIIPDSRIWLHRFRLICETFAKFLTSQLKEALILGALCFLGMMLFHFPYPVLISVLIGITNIIPYFGPVAGTIPSMMLILLVQPKAALWFLLFVVILQQIESNLIYPRIVGDSVGLPPVLVLSAIVIGGGLFGISGLILGVPTAAACYALLHDGSRMK